MTFGCREMVRMRVGVERSPNSSSSPVLSLEPLASAYGQQASVQASASVRELCFRGLFLIPCGFLNLVSGSFHRTSYWPREISFLRLSNLHQLSYSHPVEGWKWDIRVIPSVFPHSVFERPLILDINMIKNRGWRRCLIALSFSVLLHSKIRLEAARG